MDQFSADSGTLFLLMERLKPVPHAFEQTIALRSRAEYDAIPARWQFHCYGAFFRLRGKHWSPDTGTGTATLEMW